MAVQEAGGLSGAAEGISSFASAAWNAIKREAGKAISPEERKRKNEEAKKDKIIAYQGRLYHLSENGTKITDDKGKVLGAQAAHFIVQDGVEGTPENLADQKWLAQHGLDQVRLPALAQGAIEGAQWLTDFAADAVVRIATGNNYSLSDDSLGDWTPESLQEMEDLANERGGLIADKYGEAKLVGSIALDPLNFVGLGSVKALKAANAAKKAGRNVDSPEAAAKIVDADDLADDFAEDILKKEGGFVDHPADRGGATNKGVTIETYREHINPGGTVDDLKNITDEQAKEVFKGEYYFKPGIDKLPPEIQGQVFDWSVNSGPDTAIRKLQEAAGAPVDGVVGPQTVEAVKRSGINNDVLADARQSFYDEIVANNPSQAVFANGWRNRANKFRTANALDDELVTGPGPAKPTPAPKPAVSQAAPPAPSPLAIPRLSDGPTPGAQLGRPVASRPHPQVLAAPQRIDQGPRVIPTAPVRPVVSQVPTQPQAAVRAPQAALAPSQVDPRIAGRTSQGLVAPQRIDQGPRNIPAAPVRPAVTSQAPVQPVAPRVGPADPRAPVRTPIQNVGGRVQPPPLGRPVVDAAPTAPQAPATPQSPWAPTAPRVTPDEVAAARAAQAAKAAQTTTRAAPTPGAGIGVQSNLLGDLSGLGNKLKMAQRIGKDPVGTVIKAGARNLPFYGKAAAGVATAGGLTAAALLAGLPSGIGGSGLDFDAEVKNEEDVVVDDEIITPEEEQVDAENLKTEVEKADNTDNAKKAIMQYAEERSGGKDKPGFRQRMWMGLALLAGLDYDDAKDYVRTKGTQEGWYVGPVDEEFGDKISVATATLSNGKTKEVKGQFVTDSEGRVTGFRTIGGKRLKPGTWEPSTKAGKKDTKVTNIRYRDENGISTIVSGRVNEDTDQLEIQDAQGNWVKAPEGATKANTSATSAVELGAGDIPNAVSFSATTNMPTFDLNGEQAKAFGYTLRAISSNEQLEELEDSLPPEDLEKMGSLWVGLARWGAQNAGQGITPAVINDVIGDAGLQQYGKAFSRYLQAILRTDTGAAYTGTEIADYANAFGISPGDKVTPELLEAIRDARWSELGSMASRTGSAAPWLTGVIDGTYEAPSYKTVQKTARNKRNR